MMNTINTAIFYFLASLSQVFAQQTLLETLKSTLGEDEVKTSILWPLETEGVTVSNMKVDYQFPFEEGKSELTISMKEFKAIESAVFDLEKTDRHQLLRVIDAGIPDGFHVDFEKEGPTDFCRLFSNEQNPKEAYLLVGNQKKAELLRITYPKHPKNASHSLKIKLQNTLN